MSTKETTDGLPPRPGFENASAPAPKRADGQHEAYWVLSAEERAKGFVRPVRTKYRHVGRIVCGKPVTWSSNPDSVCAGELNHAGTCDDQGISTSKARLNKGCGTFTTMGIAIAETYAAKPSFYGSTFCAHCGAHFPVGESGEFEWEDGSKVGT